jgi:lactam utilization protein B
MSIRSEHTIEYLDLFGEPHPALYMRHLSDEDYNARILKAIQENKPIDEEEFMPKIEYDERGAPNIFI